MYKSSRPVHVDKSTAELATKLKLDPEQVQRWINAVGDVYNIVGYDAWGEQTPSDRDFFYCMQDQLGHHEVLTDDDLKAFHALSDRKQRQIILRAGP